MKPVKVEYIFSRNEKIGSKVIRWGTQHLTSIPPHLVPSHVAILVNERWVLESTLNKGVQVDTYERWKARNVQVGRFESARRWEFSELKERFKPLKDKCYDWPGVLYFAWRVGLNLLLGLEIGSSNPWESEDRFFCSEVVGSMLGIDYSMISPVQIMYECKELGLHKKMSLEAGG